MAILGGQPIAKIADLRVGGPGTSRETERLMRRAAWEGADSIRTGTSAETRPARPQDKMPDRAERGSSPSRPTLSDHVVTSGFTTQISPG